MKNLMMLTAVFGLATTMTFAQETPAKTVKTTKKHKTEVVKKDKAVNADGSKTETVKTTTTASKTKPAKK